MTVKRCENTQGIQYKDGARQLAAGEKGVALLWSERSTVGHGAVFLGSSVYEQVMGSKKPDVVLSCELIECGKFRNGADRWWCQTHQCPFGTKADLIRSACSSAAIPVSVLRNPPVITGDVSVWFACKPAIQIGDRRRKFSEGIHVHKYEGDRKTIDATFPAILLRLNDGDYAFTPTVARSRLLALVNDVEQQDAICPKCQHLHNDLGHFAETLHKMHLCGKCGSTFFTSEKNTCNSLAGLPRSEQSKELESSLSLQSQNYSAIAIWATTPALYSNRPQTKDGIHIHAWQGKEKVIDGSFSEVKLDRKWLERSDLLKAMLGESDWNKKDLYRQRIIH